MTHQGAAEFGTKQFGFYVQNDMRVTDNFKLSYGVRVDVPVWEDGLGNADFNNRTVAFVRSMLVKIYKELELVKQLTLLHILHHV